jgi:hypothetical protein
MIKSVLSNVFVTREGEKKTGYKTQASINPKMAMINPK